MNRSLLAVSIMLALASCAGTPRGGGGGGGYSDVTIGGGAAIPADDKQIIMPNLVGKTLDEAKKICTAAGFVYEPETARPLDCPDAPKLDGRVRCQDPEAGQKVGNHTLIDLNVYHTPVRNHITADEERSLIGKTVEQAKQQLAEWNFTGKIDIRPADGSRVCTPGQICEIYPDGGLSLKEDIQLFVAQQVKITAPPP